MPIIAMTEDIDEWSLGYVSMLYRMWIYIYNRVVVSWL